MKATFLEGLLEKTAGKLQWRTDAAPVQLPVDKFSLYKKKLS